MIDHRFSLVPDPRPDYKHLFHLQFTVVIPKDGSCYSGMELCKKQYPELEFEKPVYHNFYTVKYPDGQTATSRRLDDNEDLLFSLPLELDTIMAGVCSFKRAVPSIEFSLYPVEFVEMTPEVFYETIEFIYSDSRDISLRIRAIEWQFLKVVHNVPIYLITPTDYDYI